MRYDRCPEIFLSAIELAAIVIFWLWILSLVQQAQEIVDKRMAE